MSTASPTTQPGQDPASQFETRLRESQDFDPVSFLNDNLPALNLSSQPQTQAHTQTHPQKVGRSTHLQNASTGTLNLLSTLNTSNIRSTSELTSLTDDIIRSGNRLAYEVEVLRGDVNGLHDLLTEALRDDIDLFVRQVSADQELDPESETKDAHQGNQASQEPDFMIQLRTLEKVRARLEAVIAIFGEAMKWPVVPSELPGGSNLISVSAPELGIQSTEEDDKAREALRNIRSEITELLNSGPDSHAGLEAATRRVEEYRQIALLWKGTGEEKVRTKFVDTLTRLVEDRKRTLQSQKVSRDTKADNAARPSSAMGRITKASSEVTGAAGLFRNLQRLKDDLYLE
ncbi:hypothetical protein B0A52_02666 [Exophiala mesophila]|uniref:Uncharacterized protein n=1 Tax=Exophiala mesophila TaxID=212818 RepID=A0A438NDL5_EXOME|nr:hypothetical protein B0A52_02666 [Exophiala mesophila]